MDQLSEECLGPWTLMEAAFGVWQYAVYIFVCVFQFHKSLMSRTLIPTVVASLHGTEQQQTMSSQPRQTLTGEYISAEQIFLS